MMPTGRRSWKPQRAARSCLRPPTLTPHATSAAWYQDAFYCLAGLADGQQVFLEIGRAGDDPLGTPIASKSWSERQPNPQSPIPVGSQ